MGRRWPLAVASAAVLLAALAGCSLQRSPTTTVSVFASSSLIKTFTDIGQRFKSGNPGTSVEFIFADSFDLATQLTEGTSADVFASADSNSMAMVARAGLLAGDSIKFASNVLVIAVAPGNPKKIASFADLNQPGVTVAVCAHTGPCGSDTQRIEDSTGIQLHPVSVESSVNGVLYRVTSGQADAGLVYATDALAAADSVTLVRFPQAAIAENTYSIGLLKDSQHPSLARKFINLVTGDIGQQILSQAGFRSAGFAKP